MCAFQRLRSDIGHPLMVFPRQGLGSGNTQVETALPASSVQTPSETGSGSAPPQPPMQFIERPLHWNAFAEVQAQESTQT